MLTQQRLRELFNYDPQDGKFWRRPPTGPRKQGQRFSYYNRPAGSPDANGYTYIVVDREKFRASRLAWLYMTGEWPQHEVDHINGVRNDDSWANLRHASSSQQKCNTSIRSDNTSGVKGVGWNKRQQKWHARVRLHGVQYHCGYYDTLEEAKAARESKALEIHGEFAKLDSLSTNNPN